MRPDFYATYTCGHEEIDDTTMEVGSMSWCNTCKQSQTITARSSHKEQREQSIKGPDDSTRIANALERIADVLEEWYKQGISTNIPHNLTDNL